MAVMLGVGVRGILHRSEQAAERTTAAAIGVAMFGATVLILEPSWTRRILAAGAVLFLWLALRPRRRPPVPSAIPLLEAGPDAELLSIVHARLAEQDEKVCARLDRLIAELQER